jgi:7,8-dihydroneopterin aldolase/epimerase/oxygenase
MWFVKLNDVKMRAHHGVYEQEQIIGNDFIVNISVGFDANYIYHIDETIDYVRLYEIAKQEMDIPRKLLEEVISRIMMALEYEINNAKEIHISIQKVNPAFGKNVSNTEVVLVKQY